MLSGAGSTFIGVDFEVQHPQWQQPNPNDNDLMLVKLSNPSTAPVVQLNFDPSVPVEGQPVTVIGFGVTEENGSFSQVLLEVEVETASFTECNDYFGGDLNETIMVCAGGSDADAGQDSCQGDSGKHIPVPISTHT